MWQINMRQLEYIAVVTEGAHVRLDRVIRLSPPVFKKGWWSEHGKPELTAFIRKDRLVNVYWCTML